MRSYKELLQLLFEKLIKETKNSHCGMCGLIDRLHQVDKLISFDERTNLRGFIFLNKPSNCDFVYWWKLNNYGKTQRLEFIKRLIKDCENE